MKLDWEKKDLKFYFIPFCIVWICYWEYALVLWSKIKPQNTLKRKNWGVIINNKGTPSYWWGGGKKRYF